MRGMSLCLIAVHHALPAVVAALDALGDERVLTPEELSDLSRLAIRFVLTSRALINYAKNVGGVPSRN